jgi:signal transduction histidine kinase
MLDRVTAGEAVREAIDVLRARGDLTQALGSILARARAMLNAAEAYILLVEGERLRLRAADGLPVEAEQAATLAVGEGIEGLAALQMENVTVPDAAHHPRFRDWFGRVQPVGAMVAVPVVLRGRVTAVLAATRREPGQFGGADLWWLGVLGGLVGLAIEDDRIYRAQERRTRQAEALNEIGAQAGVGLDGVLPRLAAALVQALGVSQVDLMLAEESGKDLVSCGCGDGTRAKSALGPFERLSLAAGGPIARVYRQGEPLLCVDAQQEPEIASLFTGQAPRSFLAVPVFVGGQTRGVLYLTHDQPAAFDKDDQAFVSIVAARMGALIEAEDLRQRQLALQRAEAEAQARQEFVGIVSHELKTPVAVIQAYTDLLLRRAERAGSDPNVDVVRRIAEQAERMLGLIEELLDLQRLEAGLFPLEISHFDLVGVARRVAEATQATTKQHRIFVQADGAVPVSADRRRVEEVLQNLLDNAIRYSPGGGKVEVRTQLAPAGTGNRAVVAVADQGRGIAPREQARVFERFYQGSNRLQRGHVGLGLGLYISREIVRRHGGEMWLESTPGEGSTFYFSIPAAGPEED